MKVLVLCLAAALAQGPVDALTEAVRVRRFLVPEPLELALPDGASFVDFHPAGALVVHLPGDAIGIADAEGHVLRSIPFADTATDCYALATATDADLIVFRSRLVSSICPNVVDDLVRVSVDGTLRWERRALPWMRSPAVLRDAHGALNGLVGAEGSTVTWLGTDGEPRATWEAGERCWVLDGTANVGASGHVVAAFVGDDELVLLALGDAGFAVAGRHPLGALAGPSCERYQGTTSRGLHGRAPVVVLAARPEPTRLRLVAVDASTGKVLDALEHRVAADDYLELADSAGPTVFAVAGLGSVVVLFHEGAFTRPFRFPPEAFPILATGEFSGRTVWPVRRNRTTDFYGLRERRE